MFSLNGRKCLILLLLSFEYVSKLCFVESFTAPVQAERKNMSLFSSQSAMSDVFINLAKSHIMTEDEISPLIKLKKGTGKEKWVNAFGMYHIMCSVLTLPPWWVAMTIVDAVCTQFPDLDPNRSVYDETGKVWAKLYLTLTNSYPSISGDLEHLKKARREQKGCLYVANHASWLDIPVLCTVMSPVFKFIAKGELLSVPCIGKQLSGVSTLFEYSIFVEKKNLPK
jgi:hypothetical protein